MKTNIGIIIFPLEPSSLIPLSNLVKISSNLADKVYVISVISSEVEIPYNFGKNVHIKKIYHKASSMPFLRIINYIHTQFKILACIISLLDKVDNFIFSIGGVSLLIPILALKVLGKRTIIELTGVPAHILRTRKDPFHKYISILTNIDLNLVDNIIVYARILIQELGLFKYRSKIIVAHRHFVDFTKFEMKIRVTERENLIGYIGRLSEEKGILNLIKAAAIILKSKRTIRFIICGKGKLDRDIKKIIRAESIEDQVKLVGWIPHEKVPQYLNKFRLLVLPSFTEGLPNVIVEAMACGTPVLATPVGAIPEIIKDCETGFLLKSNDPKDIAESIIKLLDNPKLLEKVSINAYKYAQKNFSEKNVIEKWRKYLET